MTTPSMTRPAALPSLVELPTIPLRAVMPWLLFAAAMVGVLYFLILDQGAMSIVPGNLLHEFAHDGRHMLGFPCH